MINSAQDDSFHNLEEEAIKAATRGDWDLAAELNLKILKIRSDHIGALNRLARAYWEKGQLAPAKKTYQKVIEIDPLNLIATKNIKRLADGKKTKKKNKKKSAKGGVFLEEPGRTKLVKLIRLASAQILSEIDNADEVLLTPKKHNVSITCPEGVYLGSLPDDLSYHLLRLIKGGNRYQAFVKQVDRQNLEIFIRETKRAAKFVNLPSFTLSTKA